MKHMKLFRKNQKAFGRERQEGDVQEENGEQPDLAVQPAGNAAMAAEINNVPQENNGQDVHLPSHLEELAQSLRESEKGGWGLGGNSQKFNAVSQKIDKILNSMNKELGKSVEEDMKVLYEIIGDYAALVSACEIYAKRNAYTQKGQIRQQIVRYICAQARLELQGFREYADSHTSIGSEKQAKNLGEVLGKARERKLELAEGKKTSDLKVVGGAASSIKVLEKGDLSDAGASGYYKEEDIYTHMSNKAYLLTVLKKVREKDKSISEQAYQDIVENVENTRDENSDSFNMWLDVAQNRSEYWQDMKYHNFVDKMTKLLKPNKEVKAKVQGGELNIYLEEGESINMSKRNVAASRVANLFGVGDLIAQSETASFKDEQGNVTKGNLMQAARGREAQAVLTDMQREKFKKRREGHKEDEAGGFDANEDRIDDKLSPQFMKSLTSLQVLDNLMGQADRHSANYMVEELEGGNLGRVQGIDNDFAFGYGVEFGFGSHSRSILKVKAGEEKKWKEEQKKIKKETGRKADKFKFGAVNERQAESAEMALPYMDKALAERILEVKETEVRLVLYDVLEEKAIDAFCKRLKLVQDAIRRDRKNNPDSGRYLERDEDWAHEKVKSAFANQINGDMGNSYVAQYMANAVAYTSGTSARKFLMQEEIKEIAKEIWEYSRERGELETPEKEYAFLRKCGVEEKKCNYFLQNGILNGDGSFMWDFEDAVGKKVARYGRKVLYGKGS